MSIFQSVDHIIRLENFMFIAIAIENTLRPDKIRSFVLDAINKIQLIEVRFIYANALT